jgi:hypothetical protein
VHGLSKYDPAITPVLCSHLAARGLTDEQIAELIHVSDRTLDNWKARYHELREAMRPGKELTDTLAETSLYKRVLGYDFEEITRERLQVGVKDDGSPRFRMVVTKRVTRHIPGDVSAQQTWLNNRRPDRWRNTARIDLHHSGKVDTRPDYSKLNDEELTIARALAAKAEAHAGSN